MNEELKPCPFCGSENVIDADYGQEYWCECRSCKCRTGKFGSRHVADQHWNTRAELAALKAGQGEAVAIAECREVHGHMCQFLNRTQHGMDTLRDGDKLYTAPPATADARLVPVELLELCIEGFDDYWVASPEGIECTSELRALLAQSNGVKP